MFIFIHHRPAKSKQASLSLRPSGAIKHRLKGFVVFFPLMTPLWFLLGRSAVSGPRPRCYELRFVLWRSKGEPFLCIPQSHKGNLVLVSQLAGAMEMAGVMIWRLLGGRGLICIKIIASVWKLNAWTAVLLLNVIAEDKFIDLFFLPWIWFVTLIKYLVQICLDPQEVQHVKSSDWLENVHRKVQIADCVCGDACSPFCEWIRLGYSISVNVVSAFMSLQLFLLLTCPSPISCTTLELCQQK